MKTMKLVLLSTLIALAVKSQAQVSVNINVGTPPVWAPNAPAEVHFYYLPDIEVYYDVPARNYIYLSNGRWIRSVSLPGIYRGYDLRHGRTVYLTDYSGDRPYSYFKTHRVKYKGNGKWKKDHYSKGKSHGNHGKKHRKDHD